MSEQLQREKNYTVQETAEPKNRAEQFQESARMVLGGEMQGIVMRESGSLRIFNADEMLTYEGYKPEQECLKGLVCRESQELEIIAPCFSKFYNLGEKEENDQKFYQLLKQEGSVIYLPEKVDGTNIRLYVNPDTQEFSAATRNMIDGGKEGGDLSGANIHFGNETLAIAKEKFPNVLDQGLLGRFTPVFELIHPENRIVTNYGDRKDLVLLSVFDKDQACRELTRKELEEFAEQYKLNLVDTIKIDINNWDETLQQLQAMWQGTDKEGTVVTVESNGEVVFRIKVKSPEYLQLMRAMKPCTLNKTKELVDALETKTWEVLREKLHEKYPDLPEEVMMGYEIHFRSYERYLDFIDKKITEVVNFYNEFMAENYQNIKTQKDFAMAIQERSDKSFFFLLKRFGPERLEESRLIIAEELKKGLSLRDFVNLNKNI
ncbi:MAG: RNA ligase [bacterium]|nr:RNA ligase [bacterium]